MHLGSDESWPSSLQPCPLAFQRVLWPFKGIERGGLDNTISDELMSEREGSKEWRERWMDGWMDGGEEGGREKCNLPLVALVHLDSVSWPSSLQPCPLAWKGVRE